MSAFPLASAVLCPNCDFVSDATGEACPKCGSKSLMSVARALVRVPTMTEQCAADQCADCPGEIKDNFGQRACTHECGHKWQKKERKTDGISEGG